MKFYEFVVFMLVSSFIGTIAAIGWLSLSSVENLLGVYRADVEAAITKCESHIPRNEHCLARVYIVQGDGELQKLTPVVAEQ